MRIMTGKVVDGKIDVQADLQEGATVAILVRDDRRFTLSAEEENELAAAIAEITAGDFVDGRSLLDELRDPRSS